ncbi:MAG: hypothetical protein GX558_09285, partial [Clostridiales bacterium]|nr:hypothetical protein [Clostridiales bacterium]
EIDCEAAELDPLAAARKIAGRIREIEPESPPRDMARFIGWQGLPEALI